MASSKFPTWKVDAFSAASEPESATAAPKQTTAMASVTSGPATATRNSTPGESVSRSSFATPPNIHRSMPEIGIPLRIATRACPSSCRRIERKKRSAVTVAKANALPSSPGNRSP